MNATEERIADLEAEVRNLYENLNPLLPGGRRDPLGRGGGPYLPPFAEATESTDQTGDTDRG